GRGGKRALIAPVELARLVAPQHLRFPGGGFVLVESPRVLFAQAARFGEAPVQLLATPLLVLGGQVELGAPGRGTAIGRAAGLENIREEGLHRVEVLREEGIELVVVALGTT